MTFPDLVEQLLALPDIETQKRFLEEHTSLLDDEVASALKERADHFLRSDIRRSRAVVELLFVVARLTHNPLHRALGLMAEANARSIGLGEYERGIGLYDEAALIYQSLGRLVEQAKSQVGKIGALAQLDRFVEAQEVAEWAGRILEEHDEWQVLAGLTANLAAAFGFAGDDARSLELYDRAEEIYRQLGDEGKPAWLWVQTNRAVALRNLGRFDESMQASRTAWEGQSQLGQRIAAARARQSLALTYFVVGRYNEALEHLDWARDAFLADGRQRDAMLVELFTSDCLLQLRRFSEVLDKCVRVRDLFAELGTRHVVAQAIVNEAMAYAELDRCDEALSSLSEARQIFEKEGNQVWTALADLQSASVLQRQGHYDESVVLAQESAAVFQTHDLPVEEAHAYLVASRAAVALGQYDRASRLATEALHIGEQRNVPTLEYQGHHVLGALAVARGDLEGALAAYDRAIQEVERLRGWLMIEFRSGFLEDKEVIYQDAVGLCLDLNQPLRGLEYAERAKSRALLDLLAHRLDLGIQARAAADRPLVQEMVRLRAERDRLCRRLESDAESRERSWSSVTKDHGQVQQEILAMEKRITELWHRLLIRNADYAREASLWAVRTEPVQPYLSEDVVLIEYFAIHRKLVAFVLASDRVQAFELDCGLAQIQTLLQLLQLNLRSVPKSSEDRVPTLMANAKGLLQNLYRFLLAPLTSELAGGRRLIIVPHGPLHYLPFHALHDGMSWLLEKYEITYLPGASFLRYCQEAQPADSGVIAVGHSHGGRLPHAVQEARSVAALLKGDALLEGQATLEEFRQNIPEMRTLHLAAHGDFRVDNPLFSGIALSDGWLTTLDIFNLRFRASLVTLSACQTGRSVVGGGDELLGLMRAFLYAGAASLVLSLWAVEDRSTARLMEMFYTKLAQGRTKGQALRQAQLQLLREPDEREGAAYTHPYFWAPFFLVGSSGPL